MEPFVGMFFGALFTIAIGFVTVYPKDLDNISAKCVNNSGLNRAVVSILGNTEVYCKDGAKFRIKD